MGDVVLITAEEAEKNLIGYNGEPYPSEEGGKDKGIACPLFFLYAQIYNLLEEVAKGQNDVFQRISSNRAFYKKAYWLNSGQLITEGQSDFHSLESKFHYTDRVDFSGIQYNPSDPYNFLRTRGPKDGNGLCNDKGCVELFQVATIQELASYNPYLSFVVRERWQPPSVYFPVDLASLTRGALGDALHVRTSVRLSGGQVWPEPTPKFQVQLGP